MPVGRAKSSIAIKITLLVMLGASLVFLPIQLYNFIYSKSIIMNEAERSARRLALSVARRVEQEFRALEKAPRNMAYFYETADLDEPTLLETLKAVVKGNSEVYGSAMAFEPYAFKESVPAYSPYFYKDNGKVRYVQLAKDDYDYFHMDWYHVPRLLELPVWSEPYYDEGGGDCLMATYSTPLFKRTPGSGKKDFRGIVTADISLNWLTDRLDSITVADTGFCFIVSNSGKLVSYPVRELIMRESIFSLAEEMDDPRLRQIGKDMVRGDSGFVEAGSSLTGKESYLAYATIPSPRWSLAAIFPRDELFKDLARLHRETLTIAILGFMLMLAVSVLLARSFSRPLTQMAKAADQVALGDLEVDLSNIRSSDEVGSLARAFTRMTEGLRERDRIKDTFGRYVTREVVKRLLESKDGLKLGGEKREITMIMSDLRGFTALTSTMAAEDVIKFLNRYLGRMVEIILNRGGIIDEIMGDGILAFFGAPEPLEDHPGAATACALEMQAAMEELNAMNEKENMPHLEMGIAVNTGVVVVGNIGSEQRTKYGAVGSEVNFTGRMEGFSVGGQVLVSESTHNRIKGILEVRRELRVEMKGFHEKVSLYEVAGIKGDYNVSLDESEAPMIKLEAPIDIVYNRISKKTLKDEAAGGRITHMGPKSARLELENPVACWEDLKIRLLAGEDSARAGEIYGKVVCLEGAGGGEEVTIRFTSVTPDLYKELAGKTGSDTV
jgi:sigma-B regulation protein RsbU (phosphoserine phosphatase)